MSERLTDEQLNGLDRIIVGDDGVRPIMFPWMSKAIAELRARRAADLTDEEREALRWLVKHLRVMQMEGVPLRGAKRAALAVLDKLLGGTP